MHRDEIKNFWKRFFNEKVIKGWFTRGINGRSSFNSSPNGPKNVSSGEIGPISYFANFLFSIFKENILVYIGTISYICFIKV